MLLPAGGRGRGRQTPPLDDETTDVMEESLFVSSSPRPLLGPSAANVHLRIQWTRMSPSAVFNPLTRQGVLIVHTRPTFPLEYRPR